MERAARISTAELSVMWSPILLFRWANQLAFTPATMAETVLEALALQEDRPVRTRMRRLTTTVAAEVQLAT